MFQARIVKEGCPVLFDTAFPLLLPKVGQRFSSPNSDPPLWGLNLDLLITGSSEMRIKLS